MTTGEILEHLDDYDGVIKTADGFEDALLGVVHCKGREPVACYDYDRCVEILVAQGLSAEEAIEHLEFNTVDAYVGPLTPAFLENWRAR